MRKLTAFNLMTLDGYIAGQGGDISWHHVDEEFQELAIKASNSGNTLIFGRVTYELMASYWPTDEALRTDPLVAQGMNNAEKIVFSRTLKRVEWKNTRLIRKDIVEEIRKLKKTPGKNFTILGSGSIVRQFAEENLIDQYLIMIDPVILARGTPLFDGLRETLDLKLVQRRMFKSGVILLSYRPASC